jgi:biopolymer transport protein ExbB
MKLSNIYNLGIVSLSGLILFANNAFAQEETAEKAKAAEGSAGGIIGAIQDGGIWMVPIVLCFFIGLAIAGERLIVVLRKRMSSKEFMTLVINTINANKIQEAVNHCDNYKDKTLATVVKEGLLKANRTDVEIQSALDAGALAEYPSLTKRQSFLPMIANVATLSGLLGTIIGLIESFAALSSDDIKPDEKTKALAKGISKAMYTTAGGLIAAIPILILNSIIVALTTGILDDVDAASAECMNRLRARKVDQNSPSQNLSITK